MGDARHHVSTERLPADLEAKARHLVATKGWRRAALVLATTENTLQKLIDGPGITRFGLARIEAKAREVFHVEGSVTAASFESADGVTRGTFLSVQASGNAEAVGQLLGSALRLVGGGR